MPPTIDTYIVATVEQTTPNVASLVAAALQRSSSMALMLVPSCIINNLAVTIATK